MENIYFILAAEIILLVAVLLILRALFSKKRKAIEALDSALREMIETEPKLLYPKGTKVYCGNKHYVGEAIKDIDTSMVISAKDFEFSPDNLQTQYGAANCRICNGPLIKTHGTGGRLVLAVKPGESLPA